jgi:tight adherence protein C
MIDLIYDKLSDQQFIAAMLAALASALTAFTLVQPYFEGDGLSRRMKAVALERDKIRARERERLGKAGGGRVSLRQEPKAFMKNVVDQFKLGDWLGTETAKRQLSMAGIRRPAGGNRFLLHAAWRPRSASRWSGILPLRLEAIEMRPSCASAPRSSPATVCMTGAELFLSRPTPSPSGSSPIADALAGPPGPPPDLVEAACRSSAGVAGRVSREVGTHRWAIGSWELTHNRPSCPYLPDRRQAYENHGTRYRPGGVRGV